MPGFMVTAEKDRVMDLSLPTTAGAITIKARSTAPTVSADGTAITAGGYADQTFTVGASSSGAKTNTTTITFGPATAAWPTILGFDIYVSGARRWGIALATADQRTLNSGDTYPIASGTLTFSET